MDETVVAGARRRRSVCADHPASIPNTTSSQRARGVWYTCGMVGTHRATPTRTCDHSFVHLSVVAEDGMATVPPGRVYGVCCSRRCVRLDQRPLWRQRNGAHSG